MPFIVFQLLIATVHTIAVSTDYVGLLLTYRTTNYGSKYYLAMSTKE